jgi:hypothetical protein
MFTGNVCVKDVHFPWGMKRDVLSAKNQDIWVAKLLSHMTTPAVSENREKDHIKLQTKPYSQEY